MTSGSEEIAELRSDRAELKALARTKPFSDTTRLKFDTYRAKHKLGLAELGAKIGYSTTVVSKYLSGKPEGDVLRLEAAIEDVLKKDGRRRDVSFRLFETPASVKLFAWFDTIVATNDIGVIQGEAGAGKSCGCELYAQANPTTINIEVFTSTSSASALESLVFEEVETRGWKPNQRRWNFLVERLRDSGRLIIIDNAHKLTRKALGWVCDFNDATRCPVALVGNPEVVDKLRDNDQQFSRVGLRKELKITDARRLTEAMLEDLAPEAAIELLDLAVQVIDNKGHGRSLRKQVNLAKRLKATEGVSWRRAFQIAHVSLIRDFTLKD